jgi:hypothetical protein
LKDIMEAEEKGLGTSLAPVLRRFAMEGTAGVGRPGIAGAAPAGGLGAEKEGGFGADLAEDSGSDRYEESGFAMHVVSS